MDNVVSFDKGKAGLKVGLFAKIAEHAAEISKRRKNSYGEGIRRKPVQVSSIPDVDRFEDKSKAISHAMGLDGRSAGAILAVNFVFDVLGLGEKDEVSN